MLYRSTVFFENPRDALNQAQHVLNAQFHGLARYMWEVLRNLSNAWSFREVFQDCGGLVAEVVVGAVIGVGDDVVPPKKNY